MRWFEIVFLFTMITLVGLVAAMVVSLWHDDSMSWESIRQWLRDKTRRGGS